MELTMRRTCDAGPVQYEGTIDGRPFYFRARHDGWSFAVAVTLDDAIDVSSFDLASISGTLPNGAFLRAAKWGDEPEAASYMPFAEAERIIRTCAEEYVDAAECDA
ncbi:MAG TPA: hypothetical protein VFU63_05770 [Ktedonobacterales bacterium]|nr:hypothetical protein [Ktedonobacterales bacterium]